MINKKLISFTLAGVLLMGALTGCATNTSGSQGTAAPTTGSQTEAQTETEATTASGTAAAETTAAGADETTAEAAVPAGEGNNVLVVYYSATGTTETVANSIAELMSADMFELEPAEPYTSDELNWRDDSSRVSQEYENPDTRDVALLADTVENWDQYDTVFIGYPIWWGIAAWPVDGFVENNDFAGKTVIPFCTASSSGIGESGTLLAELAGEGTWLEGGRFTSRTTAEQLQEWIGGLGL